MKNLETTRKGECAIMVVLFCLGCLLGGIALCFNGRLCYRDLHCAQHAIHAYLVVYALARKGLKIHGIGTDELTFFAALEESFLAAVLA